MSVAEAKAQLSEALRTVDDGPAVIHNRGRDIAVLLGVGAYQHLVAAADAVATPMAAFLRDVGSLKDRLGGGADRVVEPAALTVRDPFGRARR